MLRRQLISTPAALALGALVSRSVQAQEMLKQARIVVGFPAGGTADVTARLYAEALRGRYAESVVVDNRPGAATRLAVAALKQSAADGSTMLFNPTSPFTLFPFVYKRLGFDLDDVVCVTPVARFTFALAVGLETGAKNLSEFAAWVKANPAKANYGSPAAGATTHFIGQMLADSLGIKLQHIAYRGTAPAMQDMLGGQLPAIVSTVGDLAPNHLAGKLRIIAVTSEQRLPSLPDVATLREQKLDMALQESFAAYLPKDTPAAVANRLAAALKAASASREVTDGLARLDNQSEHLDSPAFNTRMRQDRVFWEGVVKRTGFTIDD